MHISTAKQTKGSPDTLLKESIISEVKKENCFDFLRYLFAFSLIIAHFCTLVGVEHFWFITGTNRVKAFFTITGFLVTYSYLRRAGDLGSYARKRFFRIVPAYVVCIFFCFLLGAAVSSLSFYDFFTSTQTWKYLAVNIPMMNWLEPELPQTFQLTNISPQINGSLWSMKQEVLFYFMVPVLLSLLARTRRYFTLLMLGCCIVVYNVVNVQIQYFVFFLSGMTVLLYFDVLMRYIKWMLPVCAILYALINAHSLPVLSRVCFTIEPITFPVTIVGIAYCCKPLNVFRRFDNITYGMYLYHFPVIQTLILYGVAAYSTKLCFLLTLVITLSLAALSWYLVEKPLMHLNRYNGEMKEKKTSIRVSS